MELQIQDLVNSIKRDGISEAEKKAAEILSEAKVKAEEIVRNATKEAEHLLDDARKEVSVMKQSGKAAVEQAGRDVILSLKKSINAHMNRLLEDQVNKTISGKDLSALIVQIVKTDIVDHANSALELPESQVKKLTESLQSELAKEIKDGLEIRPVPSVSVGFRLASKDGSSYYDFSDEEVTRMLAPFLNASVQEILVSASETR
jgi:V/A-type H+-transporting ATPase subunit E